MTVERVPRPVGLPLGVYAQDDLGDLAPVGAICLSVEHAEVCDGVVFVVNREPGFIRDDISNMRISERRHKDLMQLGRQIVNVFTI
jgi:hypothetical protein